MPLDLPLSTWRPLATYRPSMATQQDVKDLGLGWQVHRIESAASYLNLDYHSLRITRKPRKPDGAEMTAAEVFVQFKRHLVNPQRGSAGIVEFVFLDPAKTNIDEPGTLLMLRMKPHPITPYTRLGYCKDVSWALNDPLVSTLEILSLAAASLVYTDLAGIVVGFSSEKELRVSTVRGPVGTFTASFSFGKIDPGAFPTPGEHPVAGNRGFGFSIPADDPNAMVIYTIGADRLNGWAGWPGWDAVIADAANDTAATWGYCSAEIFWSQLLVEFALWVTAHGGAVQGRQPVRRKLPWNDPSVPEVFDLAEANAVPWV